MKVRVIGGGPAGLFFAYLMGRAGAGHDIRVYERDPEGATYGWGLVFSDVALSFVRDIAPEVYDSITRGQVVFDDMAIVHKGQHVTLAGNTFHRLARIDLLSALHRHCRQAGVSLEFDRRCDDVAEFAGAGLIVAADGANSAIRTRYRERFEPSLDERPNLLAWYGTTRLFEPLSLIFRQNQDGLIIAHSYQYSPTHSTFLVEVPPETFRKAGLDRMSEAESLAWCEQAFAEDLQGHPLLSNRSTWFRYTIVKNVNWSFDNVVLLGDALRTGHPSIGSGTRLAMQDAIALFEAWQTVGDPVARQCPAHAGRVPSPPPSRIRFAAAGGDQEYGVVREPGIKTSSRSDFVRLRLPAPQRPGESRGNPAARPGPGGGVRTASSGV